MCSHLSAWLSLAALFAASVAALGCQGEYSLPPTPCDEWCEANRLSGCGRVQPASCVVQCQKLGLSARPECVSAIHAVLICLQEHPPVDLCDAGHDPAADQCAPELDTLFSCGLWFTG